MPSRPLLTNPPLLPVPWGEIQRTGGAEIFGLAKALVASLEGDGRWVAGATFRVVDRDRVLVTLPGTDHERQLDAATLRVWYAQRGGSDVQPEATPADFDEAAKIARRAVLARWAEIETEREAAAQGRIDRLGEQVDSRQARRRQLAELQAQLDAEVAALEPETSETGAAGRRRRWGRGGPG